VLGVVAGVATGTEVAAQGTVTLSSGGSCTYSAMTIQPNGNVSVTCSGTTNPPPQTPGQAIFAISGVSQLNTGTAYNSGQFKVSRVDTGGPAENVAFGYTVTGTGCVFRSQGPFWLTPPSGSKPSQDLDIVTGAVSGSCTITLTIQEGHGHNGTNPMSMTVGSSGPGPIAGCSAPAAGSVDRTNNIGILYRDGGGSSVDQLRMDSGTIAYYKVVGAPKPEQSVRVMFTQGQQPNTPPGVVTEISVSKCPGVIDTSIAECYYRSISINNNAIEMFTAPVPQYGWTSQEALAGRGCYTPVAERDYYVNVKWSYGSCPWGAGNCGSSMQWAPTGSNF